MLDFIHGNSLIFGECRRKVGMDDETCYFCNGGGDSAEHQLFFCNSNFEEYQENIETGILQPGNYLENILAPTKYKFHVQKCFINKIKSLLKLHEIFEANLDKEQV